MIPISFLTASLAAGAALAVLPLIIHLVMRQTPKRIIFPALQLLKNRHKRSTKKLRVKNWLLLLARMGLLALMALAMARPLLYSKAARGDSEVPTAMALVFDTSPSMGYKERGKDRLAEAKAHAADILKKVHESSQVFVIDAGLAGVTPPPVSPAAARKIVDGLGLRTVTAPLNAAVGQAYKVVAGVDRPRREVYLFTDLARSAWEVGRPVDNLTLAHEAKPEVDTYLMQVGSKEPRDIAVVSAQSRPSAGTPGGPAGAEVEVRASIRATGPARRQVVELYLDGTKPENKRGQTEVTLPANGSGEVKFRSPKLPVGLHRATVRLGGAGDPLDFDDTRFLTFRVRPPLKVLLLSDLPEDAVYAKNALDPLDLPAGEPRPYVVESIRAKALAAHQVPELRDYSCIILQDVQRLSEADWGRLAAYVKEGGGLVVALGVRADPSNYNSEAAAPLLPAEVGAPKTVEPATAFGQADFGHPLFSRSPKDLDADLSQVPVWRYREVKPAGGARVLLRYQDGAPALLERTFPRSRVGRVLLWTTPLARRAQPGDKAAWNEFPQGRFWSFVELMDQTVPYLGGISEERLDFVAGEPVSLPIDPNARFSSYVVKGPGAATSERLSPSANSTSLEIDPPQALGQWNVIVSGRGESPSSLGFSVNAAEAEMELATLAKVDLDTLFQGKDRYQLADSPETLKHSTSLRRYGRELFPWMILLVLLLLTAENILANRFHRARSS